MTKDRGFVRETAAILVFAVLAAAVSNALARRDRRLAWFGRPPGAAPVAAPSLRPAAPPAADGSAGSAAISPAARPATAAPKAPLAAASPSGPAAPGFPPHPDRPFVEISPEQAKALYDRGALFIDARRTAAYREGHVRGARSIAVWESDADDKVKALVESGRDTSAPIVVYCSGGDCEDSHQLAQKLWGVTFDAVYVYRDGFPDWEKRGWPVAAGEEK